jgi:hypothetical protein
MFLLQMRLAVNWNASFTMDRHGLLVLNRQIVLSEYVIWLYDKLRSAYYCVLLTENFKLSVLNSGTSLVGHALPMAGQQTGLKPTSVNVSTEIREFCPGRLI